MADAKSLAATINAKAAADKKAALDEEAQAVKASKVPPGHKLVRIIRLAIQPDNSWIKPGIHMLPYERVPASAKVLEDGGPLTD